MGARKAKHGLPLTIFFSVLSLLYVYPIVLVIINSFKKDVYISRMPFKLPLDNLFVGIENYIRGIEKSGLLPAFGWSLFITVFSVAAIILFCSMTAWYISRVDTKVTKAIYMLCLFAMIVPFQMEMYTLSKIANMLKMGNPWGIIVIYLGFGAGLSIFMFTGFMKSIPLEIEEAAMIDGCTPVQTFFRVVMPISKPTCVTVTILQAMWIWNDYLLPSLVLDQRKYKTIPMAVQYLKGGYGSVDMGALMGTLVILTDVKMPYMNGLELSAHVKENYPEVEIVIFSGYNDFTYAREALRYGVVDYVLKPVDPEEFHKTMSRVTEHIRERMADRERQDRQEDYLKKYFLQEWLYTESGRSRENLGALTEDPGDILNRCTRMILAGSANAFFETEEEHFIGNLKERIQREFYYINLNSNESLFLFAEKYTDYAQVAESLYQFFAQQYDSECYFAVSRGVQGWQDFPAEFQELESLMSGQFYQPAKHVAVNGEKDDPAEHVTEPDSELTEQISRDIRYKDAVRLRQDFRKLEKKYRHEKKFSEMYVKFVFSGIVKDIYEEFPELGEKPLARKVERIYRCRQIGDILDIVDDAVREFESCLSEQQDGIRREVAQVKNYILHHYSEGNLSPDHLGAMVYLSPGYLSTVFKEETGVTINRYVREVRMNKAKELLENTNMKISAISSEVGFSSSTYFCRSFREFYGVSPESCRKGQAADEEDLK